MRVCVIGTGYVGLTTGVALGYLGHEVTGVDKDSAKIVQLVGGESPIHEAGLKELIHASRPRLRFTTELKPSAREAEVIIIAVGTPSRDDGAVNCSFVRQAALELGEVLERGRTYTIVIKSTVPVGTHHQVSQVIHEVLARREVSVQVYVVSNPEFLREGRALHDTLFPDRVVIGSERQEGIDHLRRLYDRVLSQSFTPPSYLARPLGYQTPALVSTDPSSAEMIKYAANAFLALKVSFINEIAGLCERTGADVKEVARGIGLDQRIGPRFLNAGIGWGGSCFPKDTAALLSLASACQYSMPIVAASREVNHRQKEVVLDKLRASLTKVCGKRITILGLAFKPGTDDTRDSPAIEVLRILAERGAHLRAHDPVALGKAKRALEGLDVQFSGDVYKAIEGADAIVMATEWSEYRDLDLLKVASLMRGRVLVDGRNLFSPEEAHRAGLDYWGVGR